MPGDRWQQLANLRALYAFMWAHPGKKLLFMGNEFAQEQEWSEERSLDWHLLENPAHSGIQSLVRDLNHAYRDTPALWRARLRPHGVLVDRAQRRRGQRVRLRAASGRTRAGRSSSSPTSRRCRGTATGSACRCPAAGASCVNTDAEHYGGSDQGNLGGVEAEDVPWMDQYHSAELTLPPLGAIWLTPEDWRRRDAGVGAGRGCLLRAARAGRSPGSAGSTVDAERPRAPRVRAARTRKR